MRQFAYILLLLSATVTLHALAITWLSRRARSWATWLLVRWIAARMASSWVLSDWWRMAAWCAAGGDNVEPLFAALANRALAPDDELPATGVPLDWERRLSAPFIVGPEVGYGTRCSTVALLGRDGHARFIERSFDATGQPTSEVDLRFPLDVAGARARAPLAQRA